jgi:hypothetical protein
MFKQLIIQYSLSPLPNPASHKRFYEMYSNVIKVDPPAPKANTCGTDEYCMKASATVTDTDDKLKGTYVGYSSNFDISDRVSNACERYVNETGGGLKCNDTTLTFTQNPPRCDDKIIFDWD